MRGRSLRGAPGAGVSPRALLADLARLGTQGLASSRWVGGPDTLTVVREHASASFPSAIAVVFPPAGLRCAAAAAPGEHDGGIRLAVASALAAVVWAFAFLA